MLPSASSAGLVTGCRFSAIGTATLICWGLLECPLVETTIGPEEAPGGTRATRKSSELMTTAPSISPKRTRGRRKSWGRKPWPVIRTSPPGRAADGTIASMCGFPLAFALPSKRSEIPMDFNFLASYVCRKPIVAKGQNLAPVASEPKRKGQRRRHLLRCRIPPEDAQADALAEVLQYRTPGKV